MLPVCTRGAPPASSGGTGTRGDVVDADLMMLAVVSSFVVIVAAAMSSPRPSPPSLVGHTMTLPQATATMGHLPSEAAGGRGISRRGHPHGRSTGEQIMPMAAVTMMAVSSVAVVLAGAGVLPMRMPVAMLVATKAVVTLRR